MATVKLDPRFQSDVIFNEVNRQFITLKDEERQEYNIHLRHVLNLFIERMKRCDSFFEEHFQRIAYVGSYYEGLKVRKPDEFDLNIIIKLPIDYNALEIIIAPERPGYVKLKGALSMLGSQQDRVRGMEKFFDPKMYLDQNEFRQWFESVATRAFGTYPDYLPGAGYHLSHKKSGPAWTLKINMPGRGSFDVDLVPALDFPSGPPKPFKDRDTRRKNWFVVSKPLDGPSDNILWRPSFYEREQEILEGRIKPVIRQMKKLRDTQNFKSIASYYIKTLFLRELEKLDQGFLKLPATFQFYYMLKRLQEACAEGEIYDFWNPRNNLLGKIRKEELTNISCRLSRIIKAIDEKIEINPYVIAEFILTEEEFENLHVEQ